MQVAIRTADEIARIADDGRTGLGQRRLINNLYRAQDDSKLWPIRGRYNVTERAIRKARWFERESQCFMGGLEYCLFLEDEMSRIVNDERNW